MPGSGREIQEEERAALRGVNGTYEAEGREKDERDADHMDDNVDRVVMVGAVLSRWMRRQYSRDRDWRGSGLNKGTEFTYEDEVFL